MNSERLRRTPGVLAAPPSSAIVTLLSTLDSRVTIALRTLSGGPVSEPGPLLPSRRITMDQPRLFSPALDGVVVTCHWRYPEGWSAQVRTHREGDEAWLVSNHHGYAPDELPQLVEDVLSEG